MQNLIKGQRWYRQPAILRVELETYVRDIPYLSLAAGLLAFDGFVRSWRSSHETKRLTLYHHGQPIKTAVWDGREVKVMGILEDVYKEVKPFPDFLGKDELTGFDRKQFFIAQKVPFFITEAREMTSKEGRKQIVYGISFDINDIPEKQRDEFQPFKDAVYQYSLSFDADNQREAAKAKIEEFLKKQEKFGPCWLTRGTGRYIRLSTEKPQ